MLLDPTWTRAAHRATTTPADAHLWAFLPRAPRGPLPRSTPDLEVSVQARAQAPDAFVALQGAIRAHLRPEDGVDARKLDAVTHRVTVHARVPDAPNLDHLRAVWGAARALVDAGAVAVLDLHTIRWWGPARVRAFPVDASFDRRRHLRFVFELQPSPGFGHLCHTRGLGQFARPELILTHVVPAEAQRAGGTLDDLAQSLIEGAVIEPGQVLHDGGARFVAEALNPGVNAPELHLPGPAMVLVER